MEWMRRVRCCKAAWTPDAKALSPQIVLRALGLFGPSHVVARLANQSEVCKHLVVLAGSTAVDQRHQAVDLQSVQRVQRARGL